MFFAIGISSCFVFPCFATGCHASNFKIATAAVRPRNDTKLGRFYLENRRFLFYAVVFCAVLLRIVFQTFIPEIVPFSNVSFRKSFRFPAKPTRFVIARRARAPDAAIFNDAICHSVTNYGRAERNRTLKWRERMRNDAANLLFFAIGISSCFVFPCFGAGCYTFDFKIATAALRPRNDTKSGRFCLENRRFLFHVVIFCAVLLCTVCQTFRPENCSVFP